MALTDIEGIGEATAARLQKEFGSEEAFRQAVEDLELERIARVDGLGGRRAVDIVLRLLDREPADFLRTPRARRLHQDILDRIAGYACTDHGRNRVKLLVPLLDRERIRRNLAFAEEARTTVEGLDRERVAALFRGIHRFREPQRSHYEGELAVLVDGEEDYERLVEARVDRHAQVLTPDDAAFHDAGLVVYAYSQGNLDLTGADHVVTVPFTTEVARLVPDATIHRFQANRDLLERAAELTDLLGDAVEVDGNPARAALDHLDQAGGDHRSFEEVEARVREEVERMNTQVRTGIQQLSVEGDELLALVAGDQPRALQELQRDALAGARERLVEATGEDWTGVFSGTYPLEVDERALQEKRREVTGRWRRRGFREKTEAAQGLAALQAPLEAQLQELLAFDFAFAVGCFVLDHDLRPASFGEGVQVEDALHLDLPRGAGEPVDYHVGTGGGDDDVVLLTGANSGGKTTLLETLAQVQILAHMGLPVNAREATVEPVEALYFFTQKRSLDAGAFESFLREFVPIVTSPTRKLVLADELEAMTELEAAARIIGTFIEMLRETGSIGVVVTHMAEDVAEFTDVRIDGIEARGLDEDFDLLVDRTPRIGYRARSTPELILQRLAKRTEGREREVYERILGTFE